MFRSKLGKISKSVAALITAVLFLQLTALGVSVGYACGFPPTTLSVEVDVGSMYFKGEMAEFYILVSHWGEPVDVEVNALLYFNGSLQADLSELVEFVATGLYRVPYTIPIEASAGTYTLVVDARTPPEAPRCTLKGTTLKSFLLSPTLTGWNAWMTEIQGDLAIIKTDVGEIKVSIEALEATLVSIDGRIVTIETNLGIIKTDIDNIQLKLADIEGNIVTIQTNIGKLQVTLNQINATLHALNGTIVNIHTNIGNIETSIEDIQLEITAIKGDIVTIKTTLGDINGTIVSIEGDTANIRTDLGDVKASLPPAFTLGLPIAAVFAVIAAIASVISVALLLRKRKANP